MSQCNCKPGWCQRFNFTGRRADICRGVSGLPAEEREKYIKHWERSILERAKRFAKATARWVAYGFKRRKPENVLRIYREQCEPCEHFLPDPEGQDCGVCAKCSCNLAPDTRTLNKISFATEQCPLDPPKWRATAKKPVVHHCGGCDQKG